MQHLTKLRMLRGKAGTVSKTKLSGVETFMAHKEFSQVLPKGNSGYEKIGTVVETKDKVCMCASGLTWCCQPSTAQDITVSPM